MAEAFEKMLSGGHPNSLGRTVEVVEAVLADPARSNELFDCYRSTDELVRLRTSNALKRVEAVRHDLIVHFIDALIYEIGLLDQPSAQWTLAQLFSRLQQDMSPSQRAGAQAVMTRNLAVHDDWIVLKATMQTLTDWARDDPELATWLQPHLERLADDPRKSVRRQAEKSRAALV
ncbi:MAG: hypothetical protein AAFQ58_19700 [Pseudomonadota bacterium]